MKTTDVLIIGAGPGGYVCAIKLGKLGKKVLLVDKDKLGGECLNYGCIPSKALIHMAGLVHKVRKAKAAGISATDIQADWVAVQKWKAGLIAGLNRGIAGLTKGNGVEVLPGEARFISHNEAEVRTASEAEVVRFEHAVIATGSRPISLSGFSIDGKNVLSSKEALELPEPPKRLIVIGGGVIGLEIGTFYAKLGSHVTVVELTEQLLPGVEADLVSPVARTLEGLGVEILLRAKTLSYRAVDGGLEVAIDAGGTQRTIAADKILLSVGRAPNTQGLGLEAAGIRTNPKGFISVNERCQAAGSLYAIGDVVGGPFLAHKASREGIIAAQAIAGAKPEPLGPVPWAVFTDPEIAFVGETEAQAKARGAEVRLGRFPFAASGRALTTREADGFVKVIAEKDTGKLLGVGIVGPNASDLIGEACLALRLKATVEDIAATIHPHPTLPEAFSEAAEASLGQAIHLLTPTRR